MNHGAISRPFHSREKDAFIPHIDKHATENGSAQDSSSAKVERPHATCTANRCENGRMRSLHTAGWMLLVCLGALGCRTVTPPKPLTALSEQEARGHQVFQARCARCHYDRVDRPLHGPSMLNVYERHELPSGAPANDERITQVIVHGRGLMPSQGNVVGGQDLDDLLAYLRTL